MLIEPYPSGTFTSKQTRITTPISELQENVVLEQVDEDDFTISAKVKLHDDMHPANTTFWTLPSGMTKAFYLVLNIINDGNTYSADFRGYKNGSWKSISSMSTSLGMASTGVSKERQVVLGINDDTLQIASYEALEIQIKQRSTIVAHYALNLTYET